MDCPFCDGQLTSQPHEPVLDTMETGGSWRRAPVRPTPRGQLHCPACDARLVSARPPDAPAEPATGVGTRASVASTPSAPTFSPVTSRLRPLITSRMSGGQARATMNRNAAPIR
jgi:hypothetical protein